MKRETIGGWNVPAEFGNIPAPVRKTARVNRRRADDKRKKSAE
jgi:hypothetical protein